MSEPAVLDAVAGQPRVRDFFSRALQAGRLGQAYLLVGPAGAGQEEAARAVAQAVVCRHGGCGACDDCRRAADGSHPDVRWDRPGSPAGYLVDQVRDVIAEAPLAPVGGRGKAFVLERADRLGPSAANALLKTLEEPPSHVVRDVIAEAPLAPVGGRGKAFVLERADRLGPSAANALLKTLEEPPSHVTFLLTAPSVDAVLPTIASRCQVVPFAPPDRARVLQALMAETGATEGQAAWALAVTEDAASARSFLSEEGAARRAACDAMADALLSLGRASSWDAVQSAQGVASLLAAKEAPSRPLPDVGALVDDARVAKKVKPGRASALKRVWANVAEGEPADPASCDELAEMVREAREVGRFSEEDAGSALEALASSSRAGAEADYLSAGAAKEREKAATRQQKAQERSSIMEAVACAEALLRDLLALAAGSPGPLVSGDRADALRPVAAQLTRSGDAPGALLEALDACARARAQIRSNVTPRVALEALLLSVKEALWRSSSR